MFGILKVVNNIYKNEKRGNIITRRYLANKTVDTKCFILDLLQKKMSMDST